ncbi:MAG: hypothetical protein M0Z81_12455 [Deltaproteobacteria bacterium]|jgi:hypothetical protein|nr:hypothetical protein [Deltaproteobacteria bacterium]
MKLAAETYDFGAHAGSFEGYVYGYIKVDLTYLPGWSANLLEEYRALPDDIRREIQPGLDGTLGRAIRTLAPHLDAEDEVLRRLHEMIEANLPDSPDDFTRRAKARPGSHLELYEFAANAGAFEGYVYIGERVDYTKLPRWIENLVKEWGALFPEVKTLIQPSVNLTLGRALHSLSAWLDEDDPVIAPLKTMLRGKLPASANDFIYSPLPAH